MQLGMPILIELPDLEANAKLALELGLDFMELSMCLPAYQSEMLHGEVFKRIADQYGIFYTIHMDEMFDPFTFNKRTRKAFLDTFHDVFVSSRTFCTPVFTMHLSKGTYFTLPDRKEFLYQNHYGDYLISVQEFRSFIEDVIGVENAVLCIENTDGFSSFQQDAIESLLRSPVFALTYDIGHDHSNEYQDRDFMFSHRARIRHMHIHNAIGKRNHLALGEGDIDLREIISFIQSQEASSIPMSVVVETKTVNALRNSIPLLSDSCLARI
ncbi:MAG: sugar phosphate isomerase/epimerase [Spirochaetae bacterium HGW-Spirochaetae-8]|nr:MAG: sugar phosphate isomerase/epimerase [Spirochaetae bacterium HGW-Spirochaetae-8]